MTRHTGTPAALLSLAAAIAGPAGAALPAPLKTVHPYIHVDAARVTEIRAALPAPVTFPAKGTIEFTLTARRHPSDAPPEAGHTPLFDNADGNRNHVFVRHVRDCDNLSMSPGRLCLQLALQADSRQPQYAGLTYVAASPSGGVTVPEGTPTLVRLSWDAERHTASYAIGGAAPVAMYWASKGGVPVNWTPSDQAMAFDGRFDEQVAGFSVRDDARGAVVASVPNVDLNMNRSWNKLRTRADLLAKTLTSCSMPGNPESCGRPVSFTGHPNDIQEVAQSLGFAYLIGRDPLHRDAALNYASQLLAVPRADGGEFSMRGRLVAMATLYDWLFDVVKATDVRGGMAAGRYDSALAAAITETIAAESPAGTFPFGAQLCGNQPVLRAPSLDCKQKPLIVWDPVADAGKPSIAPYYLAGHARNDVLAAAYSLAAIANEYPNVRPMLDIAYDHFEQGFERAREWVGVDGGHQMGWMYGTAASSVEPWLLWRSALAWSGAPPAPRPYATRQTMFGLYGMRGARTLFPSVGDFYGPYWDDNAATNALVAAQYGEPDVAARAQWLYEKHILVQRSGGTWWDLLLWRPGRASQSPEGLGLSRLFRNSGNVLMRDSWDFGNATVAEFHAASFTSENHQHFDQNSFSLYYRAPLLLDTGYYDSYGSSHWWNYYVRSVAHNVPIVFDAAESFARYGKTYSNDGGQWLFDGKASYPTIEQAKSPGVNALGGITRFETGTDFTYAAGDASRAYASAKVDQDNGAIRQVLFLRQPGFWQKPVLLVFDHVSVRPGKESLIKSVLLHTAAEPTTLLEPSRGPGVWPMNFPAGAPPTLEVRNGGGLAFVQVVVPPAAAIQKVGGADASGNGLRFAAPSAGGSQALTDYRPAVDEATLAKSADVGAWRIEIADKAPKRAAEFLTVISVADDGAVSVPPSATRLAASSDAEAILLGNALVAVFRKSSVSDREYSFLVDRPLNHRYILTGLLPGQPYAVTVTPGGAGKPSTVSVSPSAGGTRRASPNGVLVIGRLS
jgi:hypothetical protein